MGKSKSASKPASAKHADADVQERNSTKSPKIDVVKAGSKADSKKQKKTKSKSDAKAVASTSASTKNEVKFPALTTKKEWDSGIADLFSTSKVR